MMKHLSTEDEAGMLSHYHDILYSAVADVTVYSVWTTDSSIYDCFYCYAFLFSWYLIVWNYSGDFLWILDLQ